MIDKQIGQGPNGDVAVVHALLVLNRTFMDDGCSFIRPKSYRGIAGK